MACTGMPARNASAANQTDRFIVALLRQNGPPLARPGQPVPCATSAQAHGPQGSCAIQTVGAGVTKRRKRRQRAGAAASISEALAMTRAREAAAAHPVQTRDADAGWPPACLPAAFFGRATSTAYPSPPN